ncbi:MAG: response regulator [Lachnospiraceae bacterium]|nr:response regulator [Lachnospiraceae bacterium]
MKQFSFDVKSPEDLEGILRNIKEKAEYKNASARYAIICMEKPDIDEAFQMARIFYETLPETSIAGLTTTEEICGGVLSDHNATVTFTLFETPDASVRVITYDAGNHSLPEMGKDLSSIIERTPELKCIQFFINTIRIKDLPLLFDAVDLRSTKAVVTGCCSSCSPAFYDLADDLFVLGDKAVQAGVVAVLISGSDLEATVTCSMGWTPLGIEHTITGTKGLNRITTIDNRPAAEIYHKYLNVKSDRFFSTNIAEFPLVTTRHGRNIARIFYSADDNGILTAGADIVQGEVYRLSYGSVSSILNASKYAVRELDDFNAQGIFLSICSNRANYLGPNEQDEVGFFRSQAPDVSGCCCFGEFARVEDEIIHLNNTLVALAMRERSSTSANPHIYHDFGSYGKEDNIIPLSDRIYTLLRVTSEEFASAREKELLNEVDIQKAANEAKTQFLSNMSHEIRTPIHAAIGMTEMIIRESTEPAVLEYAQNAKNAQTMLLGLVNTVLDFSRIEAGKMEIINEVYSLSAVLNDLYTMLKGTADEKGLKLIFEVDASSPDGLYGDEMRLRQILLNLLNNAIKYTQKGSITLTMKYTQNKKNSVTLTFHVKDTGTGIKNEDKERLFSPFERTKEWRTHMTEGTGLGLAISRKLLNLMGSDLKLDSVYGKGSDFYFTIIQGVEDWQPVGDFVSHAREKDRTKRETDRESFTAPEAKILVVDDIPMNHTVIKGLLKRTGVQTDCCLSGAEALNLAAKKQYDLILMDHLMPGMDGTETMLAIKKGPASDKNHNTPIIVITANAIAGIREKFLSTGFDDYLSKPVKATELEELVRRYIPERLIIPGEDSSLNNTGESLIDPDSMLKESLEKIDGLDPSSGLKLCGSFDTYLTVLREFSDSWPDTADSLRGKMLDENLKGYTIIVHALKNSARLLGAQKLSDEAKALEAAGDMKDYDMIRAKTLPFISRMDRIWTKLHEIININRSAALLSSPEIELSELQEAYDAIKEYVSAYDIDSADQVMETLLTYRIPPAEEQRFKKLQTLMREVRYDEISTLLTIPCAK